MDKLHKKVDFTICFKCSEARLQLLNRDFKSKEISKSVCLSINICMQNFFFIYIYIFSK